MTVYLSFNLNELIRSIHKDPQWKSKERSGLVKVERVGTDYYATDIFFPKQRKSSSYTEFTGQPMDELMEYLALNNKIEDFGKYAIWLHSHHNMNAFWSGTDVSTRKGFKDWGCQEFVSLVTSQTKGTSDCYGVYYHCTLDVFKPCDFDIDLKVECGLPVISVTSERNTEAYDTFLQEEAVKNAEIESNIQLLKERYGIEDEAFESYKKAKEFRGSKTMTYYTEHEIYKLDIEAKIAELKSVEEVYQYPSYNSYNNYQGGGYNRKDSKRSTLFDDIDDRDDEWADLYDRAYGANGYSGKKSDAFDKGADYYKPFTDDKGDIYIDEITPNYLTAGNVWVPLIGLDNYNKRNGIITTYHQDRVIKYGSKNQRKKLQKKIQTYKGKKPANPTI